MKPLQDKKILIAASRKIEELAMLIEKRGGLPISRPLQGTTFFAEQQMHKDLTSLLTKPIDWMIFTTGIGTTSLIEAAEKLNIKEAFLQKLAHTNIASRGYKTLAILKKLDIQPIAVDEDGTNQGLMRALDSYSFNQSNVVIQLHGEPSPKLNQFFEEKSAEVTTLLPYQHIQPDAKTVETLIQELLLQQVDAVCFTSAMQVKSLFSYAKKHHYYEHILEAFKVVQPVAVGKVTAEALTDEGIKHVISPMHERMGAMIVALSDHYQLQETT